MHEVTQRTLTSLHICVCTTAILCVHVQQQQQEVQHGDDLLLLAAHALRGLYQLTEAAAANADVASDVASGARLHAYLLRVETAALLEFGMACSPCNYHFKILVMAVSLCCVV
jgi:N-acetyltransferase B complex (NatB) non catalytic subunit